jgi:lipopolysaccharide/colanic/teichoic acid biosynthesis glycosyltransferase
MADPTPQSRLSLAAMIGRDARDVVVDCSGDPPDWPLRMKRCVDVVVASVLLLVFAPLMTLIAVLVRLDSPGPAIFRQVRIGQNGHEFKILKFRTLVTHAPDTLHKDYIAAAMAERHRLSNPAPEGPGAQSRQLVIPAQESYVTRVGRWLRKTSLDELPQLINVVRGEMSLVGPRPLPSYEVAGLVGWERRRLAMPQGMTGLWQVSGRSALPYLRMLELDVQYVEQWSILADLKIMLRTPFSMALDCDKTA